MGQFEFQLLVSRLRKFKLTITDFSGAERDCPSDAQGEENLR